MVQLYLLPLLASPLVRASIAGGDWKNSLKPTGHVEENTTVKPCYYWVNDAVEEDCDELKKVFGITDKELMGWNRSLGPNCSGWKKGNSYCLNIPPQNRPTVTQGGSTATGLSKPSANMHWNPPVSFHIPVWTDSQAVKAVTFGREPPRPTVSLVVSMAAPRIRPDGAEYREPRLGDPTWTIWPTATSDPVIMNKPKVTDPSSYLPAGGDRKPPIILPGPGEFPPEEFTKPSENRFPTAPLSVHPFPTDAIPINKLKPSGIVPGDLAERIEDQFPETATLEPALPLPTEGEPAVSVDMPKASGIPSGKPTGPILEPADPSEGDRTISVDLPGQSAVPPKDFTKPIGNQPVTTFGAASTPTDDPVPIDVGPVVTHFRPKPTGEPSEPFTPPLETRQDKQKPQGGLDVPCKASKRTLRRGTRIVENLDIEKRDDGFQCSKVHVSKPGDSCKSVATKYGISTNQLIQWNNLGQFCENFLCGNHNYYCVSEPKRPE